MSQMNLDLQARQTQKLSQEMQAAINLLSMDLEDLSDHLRKEITENPALTYIPPKRSLREYQMRVQGSFYQGGSGSDRERELRAPDPTLMDDLRQQLRLMLNEDTVLRAAQSILRALTPRGYFPQDIREFAAENNIDEHIARQALSAVRSLEPQGIGSAGLQEYLVLQLDKMQDVDPLCYELVRIHLQDIGSNDLKSIVRDTGAALPRIKQCIQRIRTLQPAPCSFREESARYIMPEFSVDVDQDDAVTVCFYNDFYPMIRFDNSFRRMAANLTGPEKEYAQSMIDTAGRMIHALEMRQQVMEKLAKIIVREQLFFFRGHYGLMPLRVDDTARQIGVHETTIYRALQGKYLYCARGTFPLGHFFQREVSNGVSASRVREMVQELCGGKMSDREIAESLEKRGVHISRRTVAKYRSQLEIGSSFKRNL